MDTQGSASNHSYCLNDVGNIYEIICLGFTEHRATYNNFFFLFLLEMREMRDQKTRHYHACKEIKKMLAFVISSTPVSYVRYSRLISQIPSTH